MNQQASLYYFKEMKNENGIKTNKYIDLVMRTYSHKNLLTLYYIILFMDDGSSFNLDDETLTSIFDGHSVFSIFEANDIFYQQILDQINERKFSEQKDIFDNKVCNAFIR